LSRLFGSLQFDYDMGSGFSATYRLGTDVYQDNRHQYYELQSGAYPGGRIFDDRYTYNSLNSDLILNYSKKITDDFRIDAKIGNNFYGRRTDELYAQGDGLVAPGFDNIYNAGSLKTANFLTPYRRISAYFDVNFDYKSMLYLEVTGRNDWS